MLQHRTHDLHYTFKAIFFTLFYFCDLIRSFRHLDKRKEMSYIRYLLIKTQVSDKKLSLLRLKCGGSIVVIIFHKVRNFQFYIESHPDNSGKLQQKLSILLY